MTFTLTKEQIDRVVEFKKECDEAWPKKMDGKAYYGPLGGSLTFSFTPGSVGTVEKVVHCSGKELDLSDYDSW
jgi:hypothetical protein